MENNFSNMNPLYGIYKDFSRLLKSIVIKYSYSAEKGETFETKRNADSYIACVNKRDTFMTYRDYSTEELIAAGMSDASLIAYIAGYDDGYLHVPERYRETLLENRRQKIINEYVEGNEYYRTLNGLPPLNTPASEFHYVPEYYAEKYGIDPTIPIHLIQNHYNAVSSGRGDWLIANLEGLGVISILQENYPDEEYLSYIGTKRIAIENARSAKNFQILYISESGVRNTMFNEFVQIYEKCRDYFVSTIYVTEFRQIIERYDNFIALCIMIMAINNTLNRQFQLGTIREFYNDFTIKMLYEAYNMPYNLKIDEYTQKRLAQSLNLLIQNKATDKVIYDIAEILGYPNLSVYKYYLSKTRRFDENGVPIVKWKTEFNNVTGEYDKVPDYDEMYDIFFEREELRNKDFINTFNSELNREEYQEVTLDDPYWWDDANLRKMIYETEYNFVESKYIGFGMSYKLTDILYENVMLLKMLVANKEQLASIKFVLPKIASDIEVTLFDAIILLFCLSCKKHHLRGEIISIPTQVLSVLDYLHNVDGGDEYLVDSFAFNFKLFEPDNLEGQALLDKVKEVMSVDETEATVFLNYIKILSIDENVDNEQKVYLINQIYSNIKALANLIQYKLSDVTNRHDYEILKEFYNAAYYSKEVKDIFTINDGNEETRRTAKNFFEYLYYYNPKLYSALFTTNFDAQYEAYIEELNKKHEVPTEPEEEVMEVDMEEEEEAPPEEEKITITKEEYQHLVDMGSVDFDYSTLNVSDNDIKVEEELLYYYIQHIISRMEEYIHGLKFVYLINDSSTPLEDLLMKLIYFFKSFTVDVVKMDVTYIANLKAENMMRLFGEAYINKELDFNDEIKLSHADFIAKIQAYLSLYSKTRFQDGGMVTDKTLDLEHLSYLLFPYDKAWTSSKEVEYGKMEDNNLNLFANHLTEKEILLKSKNHKEQPLFQDKIGRIWYSD